jgi:hypothetical protein
VQTFVLALAVLAGFQQSPSRDALAHARLAYNTHQFDEAIAAATEAAKSPDQADPAAVVLARAYLDRYHASDASQRDAADLERAREALKTVNAAKLSPRDSVEYLVGMGESLFYDEQPQFGAAAEMFDQAMRRDSVLPADARDTLFEWWANALDRQAQFVPDADRKPLYERVLHRAETELARDSESPVATYWLAAAARGADELDRAWGAAIAGWIRAGALGARGLTLRADLDRLVTSVILPERAKRIPPGGDAQAALTLFKAQWEDLKKKWERSDFVPGS